MTNCVFDNLAGCCFLKHSARMRALRAVIRRALVQKKRAVQKRTAALVAAVEP